MCMLLEKESWGVKLNWEDVEDNFASVQRAKVFGGWIVKSIQDVLVSLHEEQPATHGYEWRESMVFVPDTNHEWGNQTEEPFNLLD